MAEDTSSVACHTVQSPVTTQTPQQRPDESHLSATDHEAHQPLSPQHGQITVQYVQAKIRQFEKKFNALKESTRECLETLQVPVKRVADALTSLPADDVDEHKQFLESHLSALYQAPNHSELFGTMNFHWNYQNPQLLDHVVHEFNLEGVKGEMKTYKEDLQQFRKKTPLKLFCQSQKQKRIGPPPDFHEVVAEFDWPDDVTLEVVEEFRQEYADHYSLHKCAMMLAVVLPGSFIITWFIPGSIVEKLKVNVATSILEKYSVTKLEVAGECVYPEVENKDKQKSSEGQKQALRQPQLSQLLTVQCHKKKKAPCAMSRGSATTDDQYAYFTPCSSNSVFRYNWSTENWDEITPCPHRDSGLVIINGELTAVGGYDGSRPTNEVFTYTPQQKEWVNKHQPTKIARFQAAVVSTEDGKYVFAIGGQSDIWTPTVEVLDVKSREWYELTNLPQVLTLPSAIICGNHLHVIGGKANGFWCSLQSLSTDNPTTLEWRPLPHLPVGGSTASSLSERLVIVGGDRSEKQGKISKLFSVDPDINTIYQLIEEKWVKIGSMSVTRSECLVVSASDELLIVGGVEEKGVEKCVIINQECISVYNLAMLY